LSQAGTDARDWVLPLLVTYTMLGLAAALFLRFLFVAVINNAPDVIRLIREEWPVYTDLIAFGVIVLCWLFVMFGLGYWLSSFFMLSAASIYLTLDKTRANLALAVVVPLAACVVAYVVFLKVFYVPLPEAHWWVGFR
jgi:hypothetical protein